MSGYTSRGLHGQVVHALGLRIMSGQLPEGATIDLPALESELGVSRTVIRESLKVLTAKGLVDARQKRGTIVRDRSRWNLLDADVLRWQADTPTPELLTQLDELRGMIEPGAAALAARRRDDDDLDSLDTALDSMHATDSS